jgi:CRP-like cAMP-binding protein
MATATALVPSTILIVEKSEMARQFHAAPAFREIPKLSQEVLAEMVGTTRSRVNFLMNKFRKFGFVEYNGALKINNSLLSVLSHE